jgi:hypothetical protein
MQSQFGSLSLVAQAYERELRADAQRVRPMRNGEVGGEATWAVLGRVRRAVGIRLIQIGQRCHGKQSTCIGGNAPVARSMP